MKVIAALSALSVVSGFVAPSAFNGAVVNSVKSTSAMQMVNVASKVGSTAPVGVWDPAGLGAAATEQQYLKYQLAELKHGRVAMMAAVGMLWGESFHPFFSFKSDIGPAIYHVQELSAGHPWFWGFFISFIGMIEAGQVERAYTPLDSSGVASIREDYILGDLGFDPLNIVGDGKNDEFNTWRCRELNNGRLAMFAIIGQWAQEKINGKELWVNLFG